MNEGFPVETAPAPFPHEQHGSDTTWDHIQQHVEANPQAWQGFQPHLVPYGVVVPTPTQAPEAAAQPDSHENAPVQPLTSFTASLASRLEYSFDEVPPKDGEFDGVLTTLSRGDYTADELRDYLDTFWKIDRIDDGQYSFMPTLIRNIPTSKAQEVYFASNPNQLNTLREAIGTFLDPEAFSRTDTARTLARLYEFDDVLSLKQQAGVHHQDAVVEKFVQSEHFGSVAVDDMRGKVTERRMSRKELSAAEENDIRDWGDRFLETCDLEVNKRNDLLFYSYARTLDPKSGKLDTEALFNMLSDTSSAIHDMGDEQLTQLREQAGIINFDYYSNFQLKRIVGLLEDDPATLEHLRAGDVTVVLTDGRGDHNGAMKYNNRTFETTHGRTLFFEINKPADFYRHMVLLRKKGVEPSTLVIAAHGEPGKISFGPDDYDFKVSNEHPDLKSGREVSLIDAKALPRLVAEYMQDSRGVDEPQETVGRRRIILDSCSQARPSQVWRDGPDDTWVDRDESTAESLALAANNPKLDVYAGKNVQSLHKTDRGFRMEEHIMLPKGNEVRVPMDITHVRVDERGKLVESEIQEVVLRRDERGEWI